MKKAHDLIGQKFGRLVVIERVDSLIQPSGQRKTRWLCQCDCGNTKVVQSSQLKSGRTKSCGCISKEKSRKRLITHGKAKTRLFNIWQGMKYRCYNKKNIYYKDYGGRGITVCDEWKNDFMSFHDWAIANGYDKTAKKYECTIDRIDNNKDYCPDNCRWITMKEQTRNRRSNIVLTYNGETHCLMDWAEILDVDYNTLRRRIKKGWSIERALTTAVNKRKSITDETK